MPHTGDYGGPEDGLSPAQLLRSMPEEDILAVFQYLHNFGSGADLGPTRLSQLSGPHPRQVVRAALQGGDPHRLGMMRMAREQLGEFAERRERESDTAGQTQALGNWIAHQEERAGQNLLNQLGLVGPQPVPRSEQRVPPGSRSPFNMSGTYGERARKEEALQQNLSEIGQQLGIGGDDNDLGEEFTALSNLSAGRGGFDDLMVAMNNETFRTLLEQGDVDPTEAARTAAQEIFSASAPEDAEEQARSGLGAALEATEGGATRSEARAPGGGEGGGFEAGQAILGALLERDQEIGEAVERTGAHADPGILGLLDPSAGGGAALASLPLGGYMRPGANVTNFAPLLEDMVPNMRRALDVSESPTFRGLFRTLGKELHDRGYMATRRGDPWAALPVNEELLEASPHVFQGLSQTLRSPVGRAHMMDLFTGAGQAAGFPASVHEALSRQRTLDQLAIERLLRNLPEAP